MSTPDARSHNPDPSHLRELVQATGLSQRAVAKRLGISDRKLRYYLTGEEAAPYVVQYAIERLAEKREGGFPK